MAVEIERKFLIKKDKWQEATKGNGQLYKQGYILTDPAKTIRIRIMGDEAFLTIKGKSVGASRPEFEYGIPKQDAEELLNNFCAAVISKTRFKVLYGNHIWEVDEFSGDNAGLVVAEIELENEQEHFEKPDWLDVEVTEDKRYFNSNLSINPYKNWK
jgi:adenylate cyclase